VSSEYEGIQNDENGRPIFWSVREIAGGRGLLGGLMLYRLLDTQRSRYLLRLQEPQEEKLHKSAFLSLASRQDPPGISSRSCTCPSPLYQP
jgi:hypothetical protein